MAPRKRTHKPDQALLSPLLADKQMRCDLGSSRSGSASGNLHLERRALTQVRLDPDAAAVHLDNLLSDGKAETSAALGLGKRAVDLVKLIKYAGLL
jgi:hypothetical protein